MSRWFCVLWTSVYFGVLKKSFNNWNRDNFSWTLHTYLFSSWPTQFNWFWFSLLVAQSTKLVFLPARNVKTSFYKASTHQWTLNRLRELWHWSSMSKTNQPLSLCPFVYKYFPFPFLWNYIFWVFYHLPRYRYPRL